MWQVLLYCHVQPRAALKLARTCSPARWFALSRTRQNSLTLSDTRSCSPELLYIRSPTCSLAFTRPHVGSHSLEFARTRSLSHSLTCLPVLARTRSNSLTLPGTLSNLLAQCCQTIQVSLSALIQFLNKFICYVATKFCENILTDVEDITTKRNSKNAP